MMKYLYNFYNFIIEGNRLIDFYNPNIKKFVNDEPLIDEILTNYRNIKMKINYFNVENEHNIIKKLENRGNLRSTSEFNLILKRIVKELFPNRLNEFSVNGKYEIYLKENKISIIIEYDEDKIFQNIPEIKIITIMIGTVVDCVKKIIVDDENFLLSEKFHNLAL